MEQRNFDNLTRVLGTNTSRRAGLRAALGVVLGLGVVGEEARAARKARRRHEKTPCRNVGSECTSAFQCCSGLCVPKDGGTGFRCAKRHKRNKNNGKGGGGGGSSLTPVLTGEPCNGETDYCVDANAACIAYSSGDPAGTYCLLAARATCAADEECVTQDCHDAQCLVAVNTGDACGANDAYCSDSAAQCVAYSSGDPAGDYCLLPDGEGCGADSECASQLCSGNVCTATVPTADPCEENVSVCAASQASCSEYLEHERSGQWDTATYCLLPAGETCTANNDCETDLCSGGVCTLQTCDVCATGCTYNSLDTALAAASNGAVVRVNTGNWTTTNSGTAGGRISDGRSVTVRACNGASSVRVTSTQNTVFQVGSSTTCGSGAWILEGIEVYASSSNLFASSSLGYLNACNAQARARMTARSTTFTGTSNQRIKVGIEAAAFSDVTLVDSLVQNMAYTGIKITTDASGSAADANTLTMTRSVVTGSGSIGEEGGIQLNGVTAVLTDSEVRNNHASITSVAGGITMSSVNASVSVSLAGTTSVHDNDTDDNSGAGGIFINATQGQPTYTSTLTVAQTASVTLNQAPHGSGIYLYGSTQPISGYTIVTNGQVTGNTNPTYECTTWTGSNWQGVANCVY